MLLSVFGFELTKGISHPLYITCTVTQKQGNMFSEMVLSFDDLCEHTSHCVSGFELSQDGPL